MIRHMGLVFIIIRMEANMKEIGYMMLKRARVRRYGWTGLLMSVIIKTV